MICIACYERQEKRADKIYTPGKIKIQERHRNIIDKTR